MSNRFRVSFNSPQSGFMSVGFKFGDEKFLAAMACQPYPSLEELMLGLADIAMGKAETVSRWNEEPEEYDLVFRRTADQVGFEVVRYPNHHRLANERELAFSVAGPPESILLPFWEALRGLTPDLATDEFAQNWRRDFPAQEFARLEQAMRR